MTQSGFQPVQTFLARVRRRLRLHDAMEGLAFGGAAGAILLFSTQFLIRVPFWLVVLAVLLPALSLIANVVRNARDLDSASIEAERAFPGLQNLVRTAWELEMGAIATTPPMRSLALAQATRRAGTVIPEAVRPMKRITFLAVTSTAVLAFLAALESTAGDRVRDNVADTLARSRGITGVRITVRVEPPPYLGLDTVQYVDPERVTVLQGSRLVVNASSNATVRFIHDTDTLDAVRRGPDQQVSTVVRGDGFLMLGLFDDDGEEVSRRLIGISSTADASPLARVTAPGRDLFLNDSTVRIPVEIDATDDHGLASLELRYTKVTGSGEQFTFTDGTIPVSVTRENTRHWKAKGTLALSDFSLTRGDVIVYRAAVRDGRPGAEVVESDAFIVEIIGTESEAAGGFELDPEQDRYAVSQQMVVLKTERLIAQRNALDAAALSDRAREISIEQQRVRAEFVFMMGGELAEEITEDNSMGDLDEAHEAEMELDLSAGRMANQGRSALLAAIRSMSRAVMALNVAGLDDALRHEKNAVRQLEQAFARTRYLLRVFTEREQLDFGRRLTGDLSEAAGSRRPLPAHTADEKLARQMSVYGELLRTADTASSVTLTAASAELLASDPSSPAIQEIAARLMRASEAGEGSLRRRVITDSIVTLLNLRLHSQAVAPPDEGAMQGLPLSARIRSGLVRDVERSQGKSGGRR